MSKDIKVEKAEVSQKSLPTHDELIEAYQNKKATLPVDRVNHREFVLNGNRYFCGYSSKATSGGDVEGWITYKGEKGSETPASSRNRYKNPWFKSCNTPRPEYYVNNAPMVRQYRGVSVYRLFDRAYDFVLESMCITQRAGITEYKKTIDEILDGRTPVDTVVCRHLRSLGFKALSYADYSANWQKIDAQNAKMEAA